MRTLAPASLAVLLLLVLGVSQAESPQLEWRSHHSNVAPIQDLQFQPGSKSGRWASDMQYFDGLWIVGDGYGQIWHSPDATNWTRAIIRQNGRHRSMQNAPMRSITIGTNGTLLATFLGGGDFADPETARQKGLSAEQRAPVARSRDGKLWEVIQLPHSCGIHFAATDGKGTWILPGCNTSLLVSQDDGRSWSQRPTGLTGRLQAPGHIRGVWVAAISGVSERGVYYSRDLKTWRRALSFPPIVVPKRSLNLNQSLVMTGTWSFIATSENGVDWTQRRYKPRPSRSLTAQAGVWHPKTGYVLAGERGVVFQSPDLAQWTMQLLPKGNSTVGMAVSPAGALYASGANADGSLLRHAIITP